MLVILGNGGHADEVADIVDALIHECARCLGGKHWIGDGGVAHSGPEDDDGWLARAADTLFALGSGTPRIRKLLAEKFQSANSWPALVHPRASVSRDATIGQGAIIAAGAVVAAGATVGPFSLVNFNATLGHGARTGAYSVILPGANLACNVSIGEGATVGAGAQVLPKVNVGEWAMVGSSSMVTRDVPARHSAVGVPARIMRLDDEG